MDHTAIKEIENLALAAANVLLPAELKGRAILVPSDFDLVDIEQYLDAPTRFRGTFATPSLPDFVEYSNKQESGLVFAQRVVGGKTSAVPRLTALSIFDIGDDDLPGHCAHRAVLEIPPTPDFVRFAEAPAAHYDQRGLLDLFEDLGPGASFTSGSDPSAPLTRAEGIAAIREVKVTKTSAAEHTHDDFKQSRSAMDAVEATSKRGMPSGILFTGTLYEGLPDQLLWARLALRPNDDKPIFSLRIPRLESALLQAESSLRDRLRSEVSLPVLVGNFSR